MNDRVSLDASTVLSELNASGSYASVTNGSSMRPLLRHHKDVVALEVPECEPKKYDVVLYPDRKGSYILHRIVKVKGDHFVIRGDNTFRPEYVPKGEIVAVMTAFIRGGKRHKVTDISYKLYSRLWCFIYPIRYLWHALRTLLGRAFRAVFPKKEKTDRG